MSASIVTNAESAVAPSGLTRARFWPRLAGFVELTKPRIAVLELVVVFVAAMISTAGPPQGWTIICALAGTALVAASASTWNQWRERATDALMTRTAERPLPASTIHPWEAAAWGTILGIAGVAILAMFVNATVALLGIGCWALYVLAYTPLKTRSPFNTVVGAVAGAIPALMGAAASGPLGMTAFALFTLVYLWQFPHFMAIAWLYRQDYSAGGMKMLTVVDPSGRRAANQSLAAALALIPIAWLPLLDVPAGGVYLAGVTLLGFVQASFALHFHTRRDNASARWLLWVSLVYLPAVLLLLLLGPMV